MDLAAQGGGSRSSGVDLAARFEDLAARWISQLVDLAARRCGSRSSGAELRDPSSMDPAARPPSCEIPRAWIPQLGPRVAESAPPSCEILTYAPTWSPRWSKMAPRWAKKGLRFRVWGLLKQSIRVGEPFRNQLRSALVLQDGPNMARDGPRWRRD